MAFFSFRRRATNRQPPRPRRSTQRTLGWSGFEQLESRQMLTVTLAGLNDVQVPGGKDVLVPLTGTDSSGLPVQYSFSSSDPNVSLSLVSSGTPSLQLSVTGTDSSGSAYSGVIVIKLFDSLTPKSTARIEQLVNQGFYNGTTFSRVIDGFMAQGGFTSSGYGTGTAFADEFSTQLTYDSPGLLGLANSGPDSNDEQFFITAIDAKGSTTPISLSDMPQTLDFHYAILGQIVSGFDTFEKIMQTSVVTNSTTDEVSKPAAPITITAAQIINDTHDAVLEVSAPASDDGNTASITITARDSSGATTQQSFSAQIVTNTVTDSPFLGAVANQTTAENTPVTFNLNSTDPENAGVAYTILSATSDAAPQNVTVSINQATGQVTLTPKTGFTGTIALLAGVRASSAADKFANYDTNAFVLTVEVPSSTSAVAGADAELDLSQAYNVTGIEADGTKFSGGLDGVGNAISSTNLGSSLTWNGLNFQFGPVGANDVVQATGQTIQLPANSYSQVEILVTGVLGNQVSQSFAVNYTDGTTTTRSQSISDWYSFQNYQRESVALAMPYRDLAQGGEDHRTFNVYGFTIYLDSSKTVSSITLPSDSNLEILAISLKAALAAPTNLTATAASSTEIDLSWTASTSSVDGYNVFRGTVDGGSYPVLVNTSPLSASTTSFQDTTVIPGNTYYYVVQAASSAAYTPLSAQASASTPATSVNSTVDLSQLLNIDGITTKGTAFATGADGKGDALPGDLLGTSLTSGGVQFDIAQANTLNVLESGGQTITLPAGSYSQLQFVAIGVQGNQTGQKFTVAYTDGTVETITQSLSDWYTPQNYPGESVAATLSYRNTSSGGTDKRNFDVYRYTITLDSTKTVASLQLPDDSNVELLAVTLVAPVAAPTDVTATAAGGAIDLSWTGSTDTAATYNVYRGTASGGESSTPLNATPLPAGTTGYSDTTAVAGNTYYYVVKAVNGTAISPASNEAQAAIAQAGSSTVVDLASYYNLQGITAKGSKFSGGLDGVGYALSADSLARAPPGTARRSCSDPWPQATSCRPPASRSRCPPASTAS